MPDQPRIPYTHSSITELEVRYATAAAANGWGEGFTADTFTTGYLEF